MFKLVRSAREERRVPGSAYVRAACCNHLRFMWKFLTFLTTLCVLLQLLSAVRQSWVSRPLDPQILRALTLERQHGKVLESASSGLDHHLFQWEDGKKEGIKATLPPAPLLQASKAHEPANEEAWAKLEVPGRSKDLPAKATLKSPSKESPARFPSRHGVSGNQATSDNEGNEGHGACQPKNHIFFLKTHKTASSTLLNILYRYGDRRNLTFALPVNMYSQLFYPMYFMSYFVEGMRSRKVPTFDIMCNHLRFHSLEVQKVMHPDTFYFSILRNPVSMMDSLFTYYKAIQAFSRFRNLEDFLLDEGRTFNASLNDSHYALNILTFDFGLNNSVPPTEDELNRRAAALISFVETKFHLVLISEYFDESVVLLRHALCWTLEDVVSFRMNSRSEKSRKPLSPEMAERVKKWSALDWRLYRHFNATFWRRIDASLGRTKLREEVEALRARRTELEKTCLLEGGAVDPAQVQDSALKPFQYGQAVIQGYNIRPGLDDDTRAVCERLVMPELQYTRTLYTKQFPTLTKDVATKHTSKQNSQTPLTTKKQALTTKTRTGATKNSSQSNTKGQEPTALNTKQHNTKRLG